MPIIMDYIHHYYMQYISMFQNYPPSLQKAITYRREPKILESYPLQSIRIVF